MKWLKRIAAHVASSIIERFEPKIKQMTNERLKIVLLFSLKWVEKVLDVLTDANPDDQAQLEGIANDFIENAPREGLEVAKLLLLHKIKNESDRLFVEKIIDDIINDEEIIG